LGDGEDKCVRNPWGITGGILRQYCCGTLRGGYVIISTYLYLGFLCVYWLSCSVFLVGVYPVRVAFRVSLSLCEGFFLRCYWLVVQLFVVSHCLLALYLLVTVDFCGDT